MLLILCWQYGRLTTYVFSSVRLYTCILISFTINLGALWSILTTLLCLPEYLALEGRPRRATHCIVTSKVHRFDRSHVELCTEHKSTTCEISTEIFQGLSSVWEYPCFIGTKELFHTSPMHWSQSYPLWYLPNTASPQCYYFKWTVCSHSPQKWTVAQSFPIQMDWYLISHLPLIVYMLHKQCVLNNNFSAGDIFSTQFKRKCEACFCVMVSFKGNLTMTPIVKLLIVSRMRHCGTYILDLMG